MTAPSNHRCCSLGARPIEQPEVDSARELINCCTCWQPSWPLALHGRKSPSQPLSHIISTFNLHTTAAASPTLPLLPRPRCHCCPTHAATAASPTLPLLPHPMPVAQPAAVTLTPIASLRIRSFLHCAGLQPALQPLQPLSAQLLLHLLSAFTQHPVQSTAHQPSSLLPAHQPSSLLPAHQPSSLPTSPKQSDLLSTLTTTKHTNRTQLIQQLGR